MTILTPERLAEITALAKKATPGPWEAGVDEDGQYPSHQPIHAPGWGAFTRVVTVVDGEPSKEGEANHAYIASLDPQTVLALLASHAALQAEVEKLRARVTKYRARLEIDRHWEGNGKDGLHCVFLPFDRDEEIDGISARDETIKGQDSTIADLRQQLITARESAAREMRERCVKEAKTHEETARELLNRAKADGNDRLADNHEGAADAAEEIADALSAVPLTPTKEPADG